MSEIGDTDLHFQGYKVVKFLYSKFEVVNAITLESLHWFAWNFHQICSETYLRRLPRMVDNDRHLQGHLQKNTPIFGITPTVFFSNATFRWVDGYYHRSPMLFLKHTSIIDYYTRLT